MLPVKRLSWPQDKLQATSQHNPPWDRWASVEDARGWMLDSYTAMHKRLAEPLKGIFRSILEGEIPILFHCSAGKDRTGFCAAIILGDRKSAVEGQGVAVRVDLGGRPI